MVKSPITSPTNDGLLKGCFVIFSLIGMINIAPNDGGACFNPAVALAQTIMTLAVYPDN